MYSYDAAKKIIVSDSGSIQSIIAEVKYPDMEQLELLLSRANLSDRDERLLDQLGETIANRNLT